MLSGSANLAGVFTVTPTLSGLQQPSFTLIVAPAFPIAAYNAWKSDYWPAGSPSTAPAEDADRDGLPNLLELAQGTNPTQSNQSTMQSIVRADGSLELIMDVPASIAPELVISAEFAPTLDFIKGVEVHPTSITNVNGMQRYRFVRGSVGSNYFGRIRVQ